MPNTNLISSNKTNNPFHNQFGISLAKLITIVLSLRDLDNSEYFAEIFEHKTHSQMLYQLSVLTSEKLYASFRIDRTSISFPVYA